MANYYPRDNWTFHVSKKIRELDPKQEGQHRLWADTHVAALAALEELQPEFRDSKYVKSGHVIRLRGGGSINASNADKPDSEDGIVGVWHSDKPVPEKLLPRVTMGMVAEFLQREPVGK